MKNEYLLSVLETVKKRNPGEPEFIQTVTEVFESIEPVIDARPDLVAAGVVGGHSDGTEAAGILGAVLVHFGQRLLPFRKDVIQPAKT